MISATHSVYVNINRYIVYMVMMMIRRNLKNLRLGCSRVGSRGDTQYHISSKHLVP